MFIKKCIQILLLLFSLNAFATEKTVFLTGSCGFIGSNFLVHMFNKYPDYHFIVLDALTYAGSMDNIPASIQTSDRFEFVHDSVVNFPLVNELMARSDYVVHFAAETHVSRSIVDDFPFFETDVLGTRALLMALVKNHQTVERFIHISTSEVYGTAECEPMDEKHLLNPRSPYAAAKAAADRLVYAYNCTYDIPAVIIRPFNNYGPRQHLEKMIPRFITSAMKGEPLTIHGNGLQKRDWVYVEDLCLALDQVIHLKDFSKIKNQEINIGSGKATSVLEIAQMICRHFDLRENHLKFIDERPGQVECHIAGIQKAKKLLHWNPTTDLETGLKKTIQWYLENPLFCKKLENQALVPIEIKGGSIENY
ncbi:MAG: GDP-mannose 4,6-dehydratase [Chlamydiota bacterium]